MSRKLILTPYEHGFLDAMNEIYNKGPLSEKQQIIDIPHLLLSSLTMSGVDKIYSIGEINNSQTKLIKKIVSESDLQKWIITYQQTKIEFELIKEKIKEDDAIEGLEHLKHRVSQLLYSLKSNSSVLTFSNFFEIKFSEKLPIEFTIPFKILSGSIQVKAAFLPVIKYEAERKDIRKFIEAINSREFTNYKDAQSEIELNKNLTNKTVKLIEKAGKELYYKNTNQLNLKESIIKAIPLTSKIIELFFGKLPGILADFSGNILSDYLKMNKSLPIYNCGPVLNEIHTSRIKKLEMANLNRVAGR